jgi:crotonobetainyl-CoA:carnitine CoA-transferase CaiB-like acyl-CoA transferase
MTTVLMGPYATQILGDMGADVIKVESPQGDGSRKIGPMRNPGMGALFMHINRSKRSIVLDLKTELGHAALRRLIETADVLIYNVRPQAMARLRLSYEDVAAINPRIIYVGAYGFGQNGPYASKPAYDDLIQGAVGLPMLAMRAGSDWPRYVPVTIADRAVGLNLVNAVTAALYHREKTGEGQSIGVPMFETMVQFVAGDHLGGLTFEPPLGGSGYERLLSPERRPYATRDGYVCAVIYNDNHWRDFFTLVGQGELVRTDPRFVDLQTRTQHVDELYQMVADIIATRTTAEWLVALEEIDVPVMPVHTIEELLHDPHLKAIDFFQAVEHETEGPVVSMAVPSSWSRSQPQPSRLAAQLGQHSVEILREIGFGEAEIAALTGDSATGKAASPAQPDTPPQKLSEVPRA